MVTLCHNRKQDISSLFIFKTDSEEEEDSDVTLQEMSLDSALELDSGREDKRQTTGDQEKGINLGRRMQSILIFISSAHPCQFWLSLFRLSLFSVLTLSVPRSESYSPN